MTSTTKMIPVEHAILQSLEAAKENGKLEAVADVVKLLSPIVLELESSGNKLPEQADEVVIAIVDFCKTSIDWAHDPLEKLYFVACFHHRLLNCPVSEKTRADLRSVIDENTRSLWGSGARDLDLDTAFHCWFATAAQLPERTCMIREPFYKKDGESKIFLVPRGRAGRILHKKAKLSQVEREELNSFQQADISDLEEEYRIKQENLAQAHARQKSEVEKQDALLNDELERFNGLPDTVEVEAAWQDIAGRQETSVGRLDSWFKGISSKIKQDHASVDDRLVNNQAKQYDLEQARIRNEDKVLISKIGEIKQAYATRLDEIDHLPLPFRLINLSENNKKKVVAKEEVVLTINTAQEDSRKRQERIQSDIEALSRKTHRQRDKAEDKRLKQAASLLDQKNQKLEVINEEFARQRQPYEMDINRIEEVRKDLSEKISTLMTSLDSQPDEITVLEKAFALEVAQRRPARKDVTWKDFPAFDGFVSDGWLHGRAPKVNPVAVTQETGPS